MHLKHNFQKCYQGSGRLKEMLPGAGHAGAEFLNVFFKQEGRREGSAVQDGCW